MARNGVGGFRRCEIFGNIFDPNAVRPDRISASVRVVPRQSPRTGGIHIAEVLNRPAGCAPPTFDYTVCSQVTATVVEAGNQLLSARRACREAWRGAVRVRRDGVGDFRCREILRHIFDPNAMRPDWIAACVGIVPGNGPGT